MQRRVDEVEQRRLAMRTVAHPVAVPAQVAADALVMQAQHEEDL